MEILEPYEVAQLVINQLNQLQVLYVVGGSMASIVHGTPRTTIDVDIVADLKLEHVDRFVSALGGAFYADKQMIQQAILRQASFNLIHFDTTFKVDIFIPKNRPFDQQQLTRRIQEPLDPSSGKLVWILSAEDVILAKLDWFRMGGEVSERQWRDILGVLNIQQSALDLDYLRKWASALSVSDLLELALSEIKDDSQ